MLTHSESIETRQVEAIEKLADVADRFVSILERLEELLKAQMAIRG